MHLLTSQTSLGLWHQVVKNAEDECSIVLKEELEAYLVSLLMRYMDKPQVAKQVFATAFLEALQRGAHERQISLQHVGDQCLLFAGLFPHITEKKLVKLRYFVDLGRSAYGAISNKTDDLYDSLALQFIALMDVLQTIRHTPDLLPLEAYERWNDLGSKRALQILRTYTIATPIKK